MEDTNRLKSTLSKLLDDLDEIRECVTRMQSAVKKMADELKAEQTVLKQRRGRISAS